MCFVNACVCVICARAYVYGEVHARAQRVDHLHMRQWCLAHSALYVDALILYPHTLCARPAVLTGQLGLRPMMARFPCILPPGFCITSHLLWLPRSAHGSTVGSSTTRPAWRPPRPPPRFNGGRPRHSACLESQRLSAQHTHVGRSVGNGATSTGVVAEVVVVLVGMDADNGMCDARVCIRDYVYHMCLTQPPHHHTATQPG